MKYIIDIPDDTTCINVLKYEDRKCVAARSYIIPDLTPYTEPDREAIEDEVWEFAWKIYSMDIGEYAEIFDDKGCSSDYQEAKAKYEAWKKQKDETFDTGDEVYDKEIDSKGVILRRYNSDTLDILWDDGSAGETIAIKAITKTGRHFPEVAELLQKMRGEEE